MTLVRIAAMSVLLGASVAALVWFVWGAIRQLGHSGEASTQSAAGGDAPAAAGKKV